GARPAGGGPHGADRSAGGRRPRRDGPRRDGRGPARRRGRPGPPHCPGPAPSPNGGIGNGHPERGGAGVSSAPEPAPHRPAPRPLAHDLDELLAGTTDRAPFLTSDSKSGSNFERVLLDGEAHIIKYVHVDDDFTMRGLGDIAPLPAAIWANGLVDAAPDA